MNKKTKGLPTWDLALKELEGGNQLSKARKINKLKLIEQGINCYYILPIKGYNKSTYTINIQLEDYECNCQYSIKTGKLCSHILAVLLFKNQKEEKTWT